jgi:hypothetical protein
MFDDDTDKIYKLFKITNVNGEIQENKNLVVSFDIKFKENPKILNKDAVIDGSLKITIYDLDKNVIADGYCVCEGFGLNSTTSYLDRVGFYHSHYEVKCIPKDYNKINLKENQTFNISITPINLWMMEKNIFNDNFIKNDHKYSYPQYTKNNKMSYNNNKIETEHFYCERCFKEISEEEYELYDCMCEDCHMDMHIDNDGNYTEDSF